MKDEILIENAPDKINIIFEGQRHGLSNKLKSDIDCHWDCLMKDGKTFRRGDVFSMDRINKREHALDVSLKLTDYAHYLYTISNPRMSGKGRCRVISTSALIETQDKYFIFGEMNKYTSTPGRVQCAGGGLDGEDCKINFMDTEGNIKRELFEEMGIDANNKKIVRRLYRKYISSGGRNSFMSIIFKLDLNINKDQIKGMFRDHKSKLKNNNAESEFKRLFIVKRDYKIIQKIEADSREKADYIVPLVRHEVFFGN